MVIHSFQIKKYLKLNDCKGIKLLFLWLALCRCTHGWSL